MRTILDRRRPLTEHVGWLCDLSREIEATPLQAVQKRLGVALVQSLTDWISIYGPVAERLSREDA